MPALYHFNSDQFKENLMLGGQQHMVAGRLCQYLKGWQLDGIRFLYKHFEKGESCILNDESGLGKVVTVAVFLGAILTNDTTKKCLVVVRDDEYIEGWRFHLSVLTQLTVKVIERTSDINYETVFLIKWSTLKNIGQITNVSFDQIIIDNRGEMLTNKFCTGILLRCFENQVTLVISSADVTADVKLLHTLLRLCGRIERQYSDVKLFEDKFQLPKLKDGVCSKVDLEDYFLKREKVTNFCREFRLRRYCHQFDEGLPLVSSSEFQRHLEQWRNSENSQSSGSVKLLSSSSEKDIEELFKAYFQVKEERNARKVDCEVERITENMAMGDEDTEISDELVVMSPLLFISESESDGEQTQVKIGVSSDYPIEVKEEYEKEKNGVKEGEVKILSTNDEKSSMKNRRKSSKPVKSSVTRQESKKSLRSRAVPTTESPSSTRKKFSKPTAQVANETPKKRGRKPKAVEMNSEETSKHEELNRNEKRQAVDDKKRQIKAVETNDKEEVNDREKKKVKENKKAPAEDKEVSQNLLEEKKKIEEKEGILKKKLAKLEEGQKMAKEFEKSDFLKLIEVKKIFVEDERVEKNKPSSARKDRQRSSEKDKKLSVEGEKSKEKQGEHKKDVQKKHVELDTSKKVREEENEKMRSKDIDLNQQSRAKKEEKPLTTSKKSPRPVQLNLVLEEANKFLNNKSNRSKSTENENKIIKSPRRTSSPNKSKTSPVLDKPVADTSKGVSSPKSPKSTAAPALTPKPPINRKDKPDTPKRRPLTEYTPIGVHSRSTRGMERHTRSCPSQSKYMKVSMAQVGINKNSTAKRLPNRRKLKESTNATTSAVESNPSPPSLPNRRKVKPSTKATTTAVENNFPPPLPPPPIPPTIPESPAILESMQLGQALTPSSGPLVADFIAPPPKNVGYNFPLMLDKDFTDTECLITSQSNPNEVIILTGSSTTDNEMEPPKSAASRRKNSGKPPMVTIPRPSYIKAKSPDLFSTCSDLSLPCSQQHNNKSHFEGFKIFGSELRQSIKQRSCLDILERMLEPRTAIVNNVVTKSTPPKEKPESSHQQHGIDDEDAMFEITSNCTFGNVVRVNSNGEASPTRNKGQSTPPSVSHPKNRITNYLISNHQHESSIAPSSSLEDTTDLLQKTPKRRKSLSGTVKRSPRALSGGILGAKSQSTKLTQWLVKNAVVRISETTSKPLSAKRRRLDLSFPDDR